MIVSPDVTGNVDPTVMNIVRAINVGDDVTIVPITRLNDFKFDESLYGLEKYVLVDYVENHWNWDMQDTLLFGKNMNKFGYLVSGEEWEKFDVFVKEKPPAVYFKRELLKKDVSETILPIEYPCWQPPYQKQTREQFNNRRIELFHYWGHSHEIRRRFQGGAYLHAVKNDITIIDNIYYLQAFLNENHKRYWATMHIPHFARLPIEQLLVFNGDAKISLSLPGAGRKCFRHAEAPVNSVMMMQRDDIAWTYPWVDGDNCIKFSKEEDLLEFIEHAIKHTDLYDIYLGGLETNDKYRMGRYATEYIEPTIKKFI
jgi:hypothetical protein